MSPSFTYRSETGEVEAIGASSYQLRLDADYVVSATTRIQSYAFAAFNDFEVTFPGEPTRERDGTYRAAGLEWRQTFDRNRRAISLGVEVDENDSDGTDWHFSGYTLKAGFDTHLGGPFFGKFGLSYSDRDYEQSFSDIVAGGRTDQQITTTSAKIIYVIDARSAIDVSLSKSDFRANDPAFAGDATQASISYVMTFP